MTIKKSLITKDWRAKGLKGNPGTRSFRACFLLLVLMMVCVTAVSAGAVSMTPTSGSQYGGTPVTITGTFSTSGTTTVNFSSSSLDAADSRAATGVTVTATTITAITPAHATGLVNVWVNNAGDVSQLSSAFTYTGAGPSLTGLNVSANLTAPVGYTNYYTGFDSFHNVEMKYISTAGGALINISGSNLKTPYYVTIGGIQNTTAQYVGLVVNTENHALAGDGFNLTMIAPAHAAGQVSVVLTTPNGSASWTNLTYSAVPVITSVTPAYGSSFGGGTFTLMGTGGFNGATTVFFNTTAATAVTVINSTAVSVTLPAKDPNSPAATWVNITTPGGVSANTAGLFTYYDPANINPTNTNALNPINGSYLGGTSVVITGTNFTTASAVKFNGTAATSFTVYSATQITAVAPAYATNVSSTMLWTGNLLNVPVNVTTLAGTTLNNYGNFTYDIYKPNITSISPTSGSTGGGTVVTITGKNLSYSRFVYFGTNNLANTTAGVTVVSDTQITCVAPSTTVVGAVVLNVTTLAGYDYRSVDNTASTFTYTANVPAITSVSPTFGSDQGGQWVNITGTGLSGTSAVTFNGQAAQAFNNINDTTITVQTPAYPLGGISFIAISAAGGSVTQQNAYTFAGLPHITSVSPVGGSINGGNTVTITGTNLTGTSFVRFNTTKATGVTVVSPTTVTAIAPASNGSALGPITVNVSTFITNNVVSPNYQSNPDNGGLNAYTYSSGPTLISISPVSGSISGGTLVTLKGANLENATSVTFGGLPATNFTRFDAGTQITANTPATTTPGVVYPLILTPAGSVTNTSVGYTYYGSPVITSISPSTGPLAGGTFVTITGTSFVGASQVTFDGIQATNFTYVDSTKITANAPAHAAGAVTVLVAATGGTGTGTYTYAVTPTSTVGVFRNGVVYLAGSNTDGGAPVNAFSYGMTGDVPVVGQWTTTGTAKTIGIFRGSNGMFYLRNTNNNGVADTKFNFGQAGDVPVSGHWSGAGSDTVGVFRTGTFFLADSNVNGGGNVNAFNYGMSTDVPVAGDWNGDGTTTVGIFRDGLWALASSNAAGGGTPTYFVFGQAGDVPVTGDWNADGATEVGVFRNGMIFQATPAGALSGYFNYGMTSDLPVGGYFG